MTTQARPAVLVRNVSKSYSQEILVLDGLSMSVPAGTVYGLLGASGSGKTTLLSCILGLKKVDEGCIQVFGKSPSIGQISVGYQPQEVALYMHLTVSDTLTYFGRLLSMSSDDIKIRKETLSKSLELPEHSSYIKDLSGGQQRRVSLAVAILKNPKLLVLDEPTAGQDPVLVESIGKQLGKLVSTFSTTVIVTTHYYEEVKAVQTVGFMRNGKLISEDNPATLLAQYNTLFIEHVFRTLCQKEETTLPEVVLKDSEENKLIHNYKDFSAEEPEGSERGISDHGKILLALVTKSFIFLNATRWFAICILLTPCLQSLVFIFILGLSPKHIPVGLVNHDIQSWYSNCDELPGNNQSSSCLPQYLSCGLLSHFPEDKFRWVYYGSNEEALKSVELGETHGYISFPANYSNHFKNRLLHRIFSDNETIDGSIVSSRLDKQGYQYFSEFMSSVAENCNQDKAITKLPLKVNSIYGSLDPTIQPYIMPGFFALMVIIVPMACALPILQDRKMGTFQRSRVSGLQHWQILTALFFSDGLILAAQILLSYFILYFVGDYREISFSFLLLIFLVGIVGMAAGFFLGQIFDNDMEPVYVSLGCYMPLLFGSGAILPFEGMSKWVRWVYYITPTVQPIMSLRSMGTRGWGVTHPKVWPGFAVCIFYILGLFLLSAVVIKFKNRK